MTEPGDDHHVGEQRRRLGRFLRWGGALVVLGGVALFVTLGANRPADPYLAPRPVRTPVTGFGEIGFRVAERGSARRCALLADTEEQQERGLMNRTDLSGYDAMLFRFPADTTVSFYMKDTPLPLSIAWFDAAGAFVSSTDMEPCLDNRQCPTYGATRPYRFALEVPKGALGGLGIGPGSHLVVGGGCG